MSQGYNQLGLNNPLSVEWWNENFNSLQLLVQSQLGIGVVKGFALTLGTWPVVNVASGVMQAPLTVLYGGGTFSMPATAGTWYIMANWTETYNPGTGMTTYTFAFTPQSSSTPPAGSICLGQIIQTSSAFTSSSNAGLIVLPHVLGSQFIVGQGRVVVDDLAGTVAVQNIQGNGVPFTKTLATITYAGADITLTSAQYECPTINAIGTNSAQQKMILPLVSGAEWFVANNGTGQNLNCIAASGTGIVIPTANGAFLWSDGTNVLRKSPNATLNT